MKKKKKEKYLDAIRKKNFDKSKLNLQQKAILKSIVSILPDDENFYSKIEKYLTYNLSKEDLENLKKSLENNKEKIDIRPYSEKTKSNIKESLNNKKIKKEDLDFLDPSFSDEWNDLLIEELSKKDTLEKQREKTDLLKVITKSEKEFENKFLEKNKIEQKFFSEKDITAIRNIPKYTNDINLIQSLVSFINEYCKYEKISTSNDYRSIIYYYLEKYGLDRILLFFIRLDKAGFHYSRIYKLMYRSKTYYQEENSNIRIAKEKSINIKVNSIIKYLDYLDDIDKKNSFDTFKNAIEKLLKTIEEEINDFNNTEPEENKTSTYKA